MNRLVIATSVLLLGAGGLHAEQLPACALLGTLGDLLQSPGCTTGIFTIKNATFLGPEGLEFGINLNVTTTQDNVNFGFSSSFLNSSLGGSLNFQIGYTIDPPPDIIKGVSGAAEDVGQSFEEFLSAAATGNNAVELNYLLCAGAAFVEGQCAGTIYGFSLTLPDESVSPVALALAAQLSGGVTFDFPVNTVGVLLTVTLQNGGFLSGVSSTFPLETAAVPEPGTFALAGVGLLGLLAAGRRARR